DLPRNVRARLGRDALTLRSGEPPSFVLPEGGVTMDLPGEARFGPHIVVASREAAPRGVTVDAEALGATICIRRRRPGDRFQPLGMSETKKLQDFFVDARVARDQRDNVPLFEAPRGIAAVGDLRIAEWAKPRRGRATLTLSYRLA
ncbi:MAG TPA: tRNA lysidine(34) synthetase TilS, partial [Dehalococcoidia bacterium]|nr:tRNA lysidine(34) synthetase TilS [Dehalococcoidia bacterium]